ncbi:Eco57I restriction-modification methylase domain-containing protein [Mitsuokella jalaludinii]|uniref:Eco57I restriction-modification methylase domain-containing protein n=1 Tax=Mitsuokella jalaludinii TaxID=187979 RepID=UPI0030795549
MNDHLKRFYTLIESFKKNIDYMKAPKNKYNETSCRNEYIDSFLEILGWDVTNKKEKDLQFREVVAEYNLSKKERPDYSLTLSGVPKLFVEAKKPSVDILSDPEPALQARKYGWNAGHKIVVLTNFENLVLYDTTVVPHEGDAPSVARYRVYNYQEYLSKYDDINKLISRESVYSGVFDEYFDSKFSGADHVTESVDMYFLRQVNQWRVALANELYKKGGSYANIDVLNDAVQEFINQIVFLRICEDRNLPLYHSLQENIKDKENLHSELEKMFKAADKRYNSGLFERNKIIFDLDNEIIKKIVEGLYYPQSPYLFNIIAPNMLGKMYEMFLTEELFISDGRVTLRKKKDSKNRSIVTTPDEIVRYMASKTMKELCIDKAPDQIKQLRIADIACGSGIYLEEIFSQLQEYCVNWYLENDEQHLERGPGGRYKLPLKEKRELLTKCLYGIDVDIHAVEVAKFSLLIKLIEDETFPSVFSSDKILPDLVGNIFYGNSLVDSDMIADIDISESERIEIVPFDWSEMNVSEFDVIIGNPPYVNTSDMYSLLPLKEVKEVYKKKYDTAYKQFDKYFIFIERALNKLKPKGYLCYIVPNKFFKIDSGKKLRKLIADAKILKSLEDFGDAQLFVDKTIYSSIILLQKSEQKSFRYASLRTLAALWNDDEKDSIVINAEEISSAPWRLTTDINFMRLLKKIHQRSCLITEYVNVFNGIQTSAERPKPIYWFFQDEIVSESKTMLTIIRDAKQYSIEKSILRPFFKPVSQADKGLNSYSVLKTDKQIIFPYDANGKLISLDVMKTNYAGALAYLNDHYDELVPKSVSPKGKRDVPGATSDTWYQYGRSQALSAFTNTPKLIVGILSKNPLYAYDKNDMLIASGGTAGYCAITLKSDCPYCLEYIQAWLNNPYTEKIISIYGSDFENGFVSRGTAVLKSLPFIPINFNDKGQKELYDRVVSSTRLIYEINDRLQENVSKSQKQILERRKKEMIYQIEKSINQIYEMGC